MTSSTTNIAEIQQDFMNNITQDDQQNCIATTNQQTNNNVVIVNGVNIKGNFTGVTSTTNTDATCLMVSNMENSVSNILQAIAQQTNTTETDWFNGFQFTDDTNIFDATQSVTNNISQINEATCAANTTSSVSNNYVYVTNAEIGGNFVGVTNDSTTSASCSMTNAMKNATYNQAQASATQSNTVKGMFVSMVGAFAAIIGIMVIGVIILFAVGAIGYVGYDVKNPNRLGMSPEQQEDAELAAAEQLGITPDVLSSIS
jgi:hypothetical protein